MLTVLVTWSMPCGCTEALVEDDDGRLFACTADVCLGKWWCECCAHLDDPPLCDHAAVLMLDIGVV
jgi:hypothetical protein